MKKNQHNDFLKGVFADGLIPEQSSDICAWVKKNVRLATSSRSEYMDMRLSPWLVEPLKQILGNENSDITICAPVGSGKSTLITAAVTYIVDQRPGPTLVAYQTNPEAQAYFETTLLPSLKSCPGIDKLWPTKKNYIRKDLILFPHMPLYVSGSNLTTFTGKSVDTVIIDEAWLVKKSLLLEAKRRTHNRFNAHYVLCGQAGIVGDDFDVAFNEGYRYEFCYQCPECKEFHPYLFDDFKFECDKSEDGNYIWETLVVHLECPSCHHKIPDTVNARKSLTDSSKYLPAESKNPIKKRISFHYNAFCIPWISWESLLLEFLQANNMKKLGDVDPIRQFFQKRIAKPFDEGELLMENGEIGVSDYTLDEAKSIRGDVTILTADVQQDLLFWVIRTWWKDASSKLLACGSVSNFDQLRQLQLEWGIKDKCVGIDSAYRDIEVKEASIMYKWVALNGRSEADYLICDKKRNLKYRRIYSEPTRFKTNKGLSMVTYYSSNSVKDVLFRLKNGLGAPWEVPSDVSDDYKKQLNSEIKVLDQGKFFYKQIHNRNHMLDCCCMNIIMSMGHGCWPSRHNMIGIEENASPPIEI